MTTILYTELIGTCALFLILQKGANSVSCALLRRHCGCIASQVYNFHRADIRCQCQ
jgi:hypothetical protein